MPQRKSLTSHEYDGVDIHVGQVFHVNSEHVGLLLALGRIAPEPGEQGYVPRDSTAAAPAPYQTRDMAPERTKRPYHRKAA